MRSTPSPEAAPPFDLPADSPEVRENGLRTRVRHLEVVYRLSTQTVSAQSLACIYRAALEAVMDGLGADRASLLLFDDSGSLAFKASEGLSAPYKAAVQGHSPWQPDSPDAQPILVPDVLEDPDLAPYSEIIRAEGISALAFFPLRHEGRVLGKFMAYFDAPHAFTTDEQRVGEMIANHLANVIARRQAEEAREALHAQQEAERSHLEAVMRHMPVGIAIIRVSDGEILLRNAFADALWSQAESTLLGEGGVLDRVTQSGNTEVNIEIPYDRLQGRSGHASLRASPIKRGDDSVSSVVVVLEDITEQKRNQSSLRFLADASMKLAESLDSDETLQRVAELMVPEFADWCEFDLLKDDGELQPVSVVHSDPEKVAMAHRIRTKYPPSVDREGGIGHVIRTKQMLFVPQIEPELLSSLAVNEEHLKLLMDLGLRSGIVLPLMARGRVLGTLTLIMAESGRHYRESDLPYVEEIAHSCALAIDNARLYDNARRELEERQRAEAALRESEERYRMLSEATSDYIFSYRRNEDGEFVLEWISEAFERMTGYSTEEIIDRGRWVQYIPDDDLDTVREFSERMRGGERSAVEHRFTFKSGETGWLRVVGRPVADPETGEVIRILGAGQDITARKHAELALQRLAAELEERVQDRTSALESTNALLRNEIKDRTIAEEQLAKANEALMSSNRELQDFAYVASHDLQEPLRKIQSFADLLRSDYGPRLDDQAHFYIERMQSAARRMSDLIKGLLAYSRVRTQVLPFQPVDLGNIVRDVISDLEITISETQAAISVTALPTVEADPTQMRQLFQNLIGNALKFRHEDRPPIVRISESRNDTSCRIEISDNGIGFATEYAERIFAPFQRLHGQASFPGTGMGLAICRRIAERHGGSVSARSVPGSGSTFEIRLPLRQREPDAIGSNADEKN